MASTGDIDFGGLCFNGHDVPRGARYCPQCGTPATAPSGTPPPPPPPLPAPAPGYATYPRGPAGYGTGYGAGYAPYRPGYAPPPATWSPGWPAPGWPAGGYAAPWARRPLNAASVVAVVLSLVWFWGLASLTAVIVGHVSLRQISRRGERGRGLAVTGLVIGYLGLALTIVFITLTATRG